MLTRNQKRMALAVPFALLCLFAAVPTASAEDGVHVYSEEGSYTVTVPADVKVNEASKTGTLEIKGTLDACYNLEINIASANSYKLVNGSYNLTYTLSDTSVVFSKEAGSTAKDYSYTLNIDVTGTPVVSGTYTDTLTFTMDAKNYEATTHKLKFDANCSSDESLVISTSEKFVTSGEAYGLLPTPHRDGYDFAGWYTEATNGEQVTSETIMETADTTVYAHWTAHILTINYHNDGAEYIHWDSPAHNQDVQGQEITISHQEAYGSTFSNGKNGLYDVWRWLKTGYDVHGTFWKIGPDGKKQYSDKQGFATAQECAEYLGVLDAFKKGNVTVDLYPIWIANTYTVKYDGNGATGSTADSKHTYDVAASLTPNGFVKEGYTFAGWNTEKDGNGTSYVDGAEVTNLTATNNATVTLYAQWTPNVLTIKYHSGGAQKWKQYPGDKIISINTSDEVVITETVGYDAEYEHYMYGILDVGRLMREGYHSGFEWRIDSPDSEQTVTDTSPSTGSDYKYLGKEVAEWLHVGDQFKKGSVTVELYPVFVANTYTVCYNGNGATGGSTSESKHTYDVSAPLNRNGFIRLGCTFTGWNTSSDGSGTTYSDGQDVQNLTTENNVNVTLYAQWKPDDSSNDTTTVAEAETITEAGDDTQ